MPNDLSSVVATAVSEAKGESTDGESVATDTGVVEGGDTGAAGETGAGVEATPQDGTPVAEPPTPEPPDDLATELEGLGIKAPAPGKPENRIPYSRVRKMTEGLRTKLTTAHKAELDAREAKIAEAERKHAELIQQALRDPETNLRQLIEANPAYREVIKKMLEGEAPAAQAVPAGDPRPEPDHTFPDGTKGFTQEGMDKLLEWNARRAEERAYQRSQKEMEKRFGPIAKEWQVQKAYEAQVPMLRNRIDRVHRLWGQELVDKHQVEITEALKQQPDPTAPGVFEQVVSEVLLPKIAANRTSMREDIIKELKAAPVAASKVAPSSSAAPVEGGARTLEQAIKESLAAAGLR